MNKQLVFIHGGEAYSNPVDYELYLQGAEVDVEYAEKQRWHYVPALQSALGSDWQVVRPEMPCSENAQYAHWKIWFEKYIPLLQDGVVLMGHSLGAMFLARYLSENTLPVSVSKLFLLAGEFTRRSNIQPGEEDGEYFYTHLDNFAQLDNAVKQIHIVHSVDDPVVPFENAALFAQHLPNAHTVQFSDRGHFWDADFPELIQLIQG